MIERNDVYETLSKAVIYNENSFENLYNIMQSMRVEVNFWGIGGYKLPGHTGEVRNWQVKQLFCRLLKKNPHFSLAERKIGKKIYYRFCWLNQHEDTLSFKRGPLIRWIRERFFCIFDRIYHITKQKRWWVLSNGPYYYLNSYTKRQFIERYKVAPKILKHSGGRHQDIYGSDSKRWSKPKKNELEEFFINQEIINK